MSNRRWVAAAGAVAGLVLVLALVAAAGRGRAPGAASGDAASGSASAPGEIALATATPPAVATPTPATTASPTTQPTPEPTPRAPTAAPRATGDPRLAWAEFLLRVNDDRSTVDALNRSLLTATDDGDRDAVRDAAVEILDFVDRERDWLAGHPPAECYAAAHASAGAMLATYGAAAERFIDWTSAGEGLAALGAFGLAIETAGDAAEALDAFATILGTTTCPA